MRNCTDDALCMWLCCAYQPHLRCTLCLQLQGTFEPIKVDESSLTGESLPVTKSHGSKVQPAPFVSNPHISVYTLLSSLCYVHGVCLGIFGARSFHIVLL